LVEIFNGVTFVSDNIVDMIRTINALFAECEAKINTVSRNRFSCSHVWEYVKKVPQVSFDTIAREIKLSDLMIRMALKTLESIGIFEEISGEKCDKIHALGAIWTRCPDSQSFPQQHFFMKL
jgi:hypothetical protein